MTRNPNLVPTVVTDVNGRKTTVYKSPVVESARKTKLPKPFRTGPSMEELIALADLQRSVSEPVIEMIGATTQYIHEVRTSVRKYSPEFLREVLPLLEGDPVIARGTATLISGDHAERTIREMAYFHPLLGESKYFNSYGYVMALYYYKATHEQTDLSRADDHLREGYLALMKSAQRLFNEFGSSVSADEHPVRSQIIRYGSMRSLQNDGIIELIMSRPKDADTIVDVMIKHQLTTSNKVLGIIDGVAPSIASGAL